MWVDDPEAALHVLWLGLSSDKPLSKDMGRIIEFRQSSLHILWWPQPQL
jgi:hypothetical protein